MTTAQFKPSIISVVMPWLIATLMVVTVGVVVHFYIPNAGDQLLKIYFSIIVLIFGCGFISVSLYLFSSFYDFYINSKGIYALVFSCEWPEVEDVIVKKELGQQNVYLVTKRKKKILLNISTEDKHGLYFAFGKCIHPKFAFKKKLLSLYKNPPPQVPKKIIKNDDTNYDNLRFKKLILLAYMFLMVVIAGVGAAFLIN